MKRLYEEGMHRMEIGQYDEAIEAFNQMKKIDPSFAPAYNFEGVAHMRKRTESTDAILAFEKAIAINPGYVEPYLNLGTLYMEADGEYEQAAEYYQKAIEIDPKNGRAYFGLGWIELTDRHRPEIAEGFFRKVTEIHPDFPEGFYGLGLAYLELKKPEMTLEPISRLRALGREEMALQIENLLRQNGLNPFGPAGMATDSGPESSGGATLPVSSSSHPSSAAAGVSESGTGSRRNDQGGLRSGF
ncbi:MAG: tetratricopeptide repeat protein [Candidatus Omnitrophota bacterium]